ncbi:DNA-directed DNA polymerase isoform X2 [Tasmannia lanceolata]|uniref:DNA-directed DNA polymerase isoform X2 n=1 Tax=Tasmannia lanceolata TaxID=3420 RepID=UPI004062EFF6
MSFDSSRSSANSHGKEEKKRSLDSNNPSSHHKIKKKKGQNQKTLGVAWGANSLSSSKSSSRRSPFTDFSSYMEVKNQKLRNQFDADASSSSATSGSNSIKGLFHGVSIFVDGFTIPSSQELRGYMLKHGGRFENYFSRHRVTHIICSNLPDSKVRNLRSFSGGLPVVKPTWVLDSVIANRVLSWVPYQLDQLANETRNQQKLSVFFPLKSNSKSEDVEIPAKVHENFETEGSLPMGDSSKNKLLMEVGEFLESKSQRREESACLEHENSCEVGMEGPSFTAVEGEDVVREAFQSSPNRPSASVSSYCFDNRDNKKSPSSRSQGPYNQRHSTLGDPNFVENYFKNSRLHFIGTWRSRYRKRFPQLLNGVKHGNPNINALSTSERTSIIHVDMDCFFVSVVLRKYPELLDKPVAVCHSDNPKGTAEISSANYPARDYGVRAGMFVRDAKALCPHLVIFPYNFEAYEEVADQFYNILHKYCNKVQAISCDEAFLDVSHLESDDPENIASIIRQEIFETTGCTASAGIAGNLLIARLATQTAKPNGQCFIPFDKVDDYFKNLPIKALPGIGHVLSEKLKSQNIQTCGELRVISKEVLQKDFGTKTGDMLWNYSRGVDLRAVEVVQETKSIGAEVNWGVRFNDVKDSRDFLVKLCKEVSLRLQGCGMQGRTITLKVKKRKKGAGEPQKYMGCGDCENLSHSLTVPIATDDAEVLQRIAKQLFGSFSLGHEKNTLQSWLVTASENTGKTCQTICPAKETSNGDILLVNGKCKSNNFDREKEHFGGNSGQLCIDETVSSHINRSSGDAYIHKASTLPPICHLDMVVLENLPPEIISEINEMYSGRLIEFMEKSKGKDGRLSTSVCAISLQEIEGARNKGKEPVCSSPVHPNNKITESTGPKIPNASVSCSGSSDLHNTTMYSDQVDLMPASLSQIDISVLQELPDELKADILELLPAHRTSEHSGDTVRGYVREYPIDSIRMNNSGCSMEGFDLVSNSNLWIGNPPKWVDKFKASNCLTLNILAQFYYKSGSNGVLSSILRCIISTSPLSLDSCSEECDDALSCLCELFKQYIKLKIESDIEELYICFRLLKRFTTKSDFLLQVYNLVLPSLQACIGESYGGNLQLSHAKE